MVLAGQWLERPALVDAGDATLEALYHRGARRPALVLCPSPGPGGGMDAPPLAEIAWAAARAGHPSLRFQHRGVGASQGTLDPARAVDDALAAFRHLADTAGPRLAVAALGGGAATALAIARARPEVERLVLVAPDALPGEAVGARVLVLLPEAGAALSRADAEGRLGTAARVEVVDGADAAFRSGLPEVGRRAVAWIASRA